MKWSWTALVLLLVTRIAAADPLRVYFFDVGEGDAALVISPTGQALLIDAGPAGSAASLRHRLESLHPGALDYALLTHSHLDHLGGLAEVLGAIGAKQLIDSGFADPSPARQALDSLLHAKNIAIRQAFAGDRVDLGGGATVTFLGPPSPFAQGTRSDVHSNSVVARLDYDRVRVLFMGDAEAEAEASLMSSNPDGLSANVLKVGRHGASTASTTGFLKQVHPEYAVISVGAGNDLDLPAESTIARLTEVGARVLRTDVDGELLLSTDGTHLTLAPVAPSAVVAPLAPPESPHPAGKVVGSKHPGVFHTLECPTGRKLRPNNRLIYPSREAALRAGKTPARDCNP